MKKIEPCPFCGRGDGLRVGRSKPFLRVECKNCWAHGPSHQDREHAINAWNSAPRKVGAKSGVEEFTCSCGKVIPIGPNFIQAGVEAKLLSVAMDGSYVDAKLTCIACGSNKVRRFKNNDPGNTWREHV